MQVYSDLTEDNRVVKFAVSSIMDEDITIGTKVKSFLSIRPYLIKSMIEHDFNADRIPGQGFIHIPKARHYISGGIGRRRQDLSKYVLRFHRGMIGVYLKREYAEPVTDCHMVVYTRDAYLADPDIEENPREAEELRARADIDYVLVAVLSSCEGYTPSLSPYRFVKNLAGGNHEALAWSAEEIRVKAREIAANEDEWCMVSD